MGGEIWDHDHRSFGTATTGDQTLEDAAPEELREFVSRIRAPDEEEMKKLRKRAEMLGLIEKSDSTKH